ncbi:uncharacterized protein CDV56_103130 [Aspergillus thermomutatus]|uniref:Uncharacterized protein n=1 Tax=Aspergillus thermomutatus TaxID=41047 RepID=A0A397G606_ASPTH|nr:uncharacterized protein CDV56_103130 [Aspergillus thermomutatus]RHZ45038.1 hypothetical protein CDV56_103130 [Aspergillus thermomutatus]
MSTLNLNQAYTYLVEAGLFQHTGRGGAKTNTVPVGIQNGSKLEAGPLGNLKSAVSEQVQRINDPGTLSLPALEVRGGLNAADVLKKAVEVAAILKVEGAEEASKKLITIINGTDNNPTDNNPTDNDRTNNDRTDNSGSGNNDSDDSSGKTDRAPSDSIVDLENRSAKYTWDRHGLQYVTTIEDGDEVTLLVEEKTARKSVRSKDETVSYYHVEIKDRKTGKYQRQIKSAADVEPLLDDWNKLERKMVIHAGSKKEKFTRKSTGGVKKFHWFACRRLQRGNKDSMARDANTKCCVEFNLIKGIKVLLLNDLRHLSGETKVNDWVKKTGGRDRQRLPMEEEPRKYEEVNLAYDSDQGQRGRKGKTWRQIQKESYARRGIPLGEEAAPIQGEIESRVQRVEQRIDGLAKDFGDYKGILESLVKTIESTNTKLEKIGEDRQETKNAIKSLAERIDEISRAHAVIAPFLSNLFHKVVYLLALYEVV